MEFRDLYAEGSQSKGPRPIRLAGGAIYFYNYNTKRLSKMEEEKITYKQSIVDVIINDENIIKIGDEVKKYYKDVKEEICEKLLKLDDWHHDFVNLQRLINYMAKKSIHSEIVVSSPKLLYAIDAAAGGGALIAKSGTYTGHYYLYDLNNSYNNFFVKNKIPSNPVVMSVKRIFNKKLVLYRLKIDKEFLTKEMVSKFKTKREWFTYTDIKIFDMFGVKYELVNEKYNCIDFKDKLDCNFEWMETLNTAKHDKIDVLQNPKRIKIIKHLLSSFWGNVCKFEYTTEKEYGKEIPEYLFHRTGEKSSDSLYIHPEKFYTYAIGICKPFVLAEGRYNLLSQVNKVQKLGHDVVFSHTDSIITSCPPEHFDIGTNIGQWKLEKQSEKGVEVKNIAAKKFLY